MTDKTFTKMFLPKIKKVLALIAWNADAGINNKLDGFIAANTKLIEENIELKKENEELQEQNKILHNSCDTLNDLIKKALCPICLNTLGEKELIGFDDNGNICHKHCEGKDEPET